LDCYHRMGQQVEGLKLIRAHYMRYPSLDTFNVVFRELRAQEGYHPAWAFARESLREHPSLLGLDRLLEAELATPEGAHAYNTRQDTALASSAADGARAVAVPSVDMRANADLTLLRSLIHKHTQR